MNKYFAGFMVLYLLQFFYCHSIGNCCWTDYSGLIKKVANPMEKNIVLFYQKHQCHPVFEETRKLLEESGCEQAEKVSQREIAPGYIRTLYSCVFTGNKVMVTIGIADDDVPYILYFDKGTSGCRIGLTKSGESEDKPNCGKSFCLNMPRG